MPTIDVKDAAGSTVTIQAPNGNGRAGAANSRPVVLANEDLAAVNAIVTAIAAAEFFPETQPVSGTVAVSGSVAVTGTFYPATQPVSAASLPLPTGAATEATLGAIEAALGGTLTVDVTGSVAVTGTFYPATQPVSAAALPLPAGAATGAKQDEAKVAIEALGAATSWFAITPADSDLATQPEAIYVGGAGNLVVRGSNDVDATLAVLAGQVLPIKPKQVRSTGTTATGLVGLVN